ncbi:MAG: zinc ribbon domain-containing protein, partial [Erysipelotrichaceae bacterium]|nr:zinc ribbon domain-containing protein [Erysipelotrichaceae bacterium]
MNHNGKYCPKCGRKLDETSKYCPYCGTERSQYTVNGFHPESEKKKKRVWLMIGLVLVIAVGGVFGTVTVYSKQKQEKYGQTIETANRFFKETKYKEAEDSYLAALEIDPKIKTPYVPLYNIYIIEAESKKAEDILKKAKEKLSETDLKEVEAEAKNVKKDYEAKKAEEAKKKAEEE